MYIRSKLSHVIRHPSPIIALSCRSAHPFNEWTRSLHDLENLSTYRFQTKCTTTAKCFMNSISTSVQYDLHHDILRSMGLIIMSDNNQSEDIQWLTRYYFDIGAACQEWIDRLGLHPEQFLDKSTFDQEITVKNDRDSVYNMLIQKRMYLWVWDFMHEDLSSYIHESWHRVSILVSEGSIVRKPLTPFFLI